MLVPIVIFLVDLGIIAQLHIAVHGRVLKISACVGCDGNHLQNRLAGFKSRTILLAMVIFQFMVNDMVIQSLSMIAVRRLHPVLEVVGRATNQQPRSRRLGAK